MQGGGLNAPLPRRSFVESLSKVLVIGWASQSFYACMLLQLLLLLLLLLRILGSEFFGSLPPNNLWQVLSLESHFDKYRTHVGATKQGSISMKRSACGRQLQPGKLHIVFNVQFSACTNINFPGVLTPMHESICNRQEQLKCCETQPTSCTAPTLTNGFDIFAAFLGHL